jgi:hypothetical protein
VNRALVFRACACFSIAETCRRFRGPRSALSVCRRIGRLTGTTDARLRTVGQQIITKLDEIIPGGPNCYRRVLVTTCFDAVAAHQSVVFGFRSNGNVIGHAWFESSPDELSASYPARVVL